MAEHTNPIKIDPSLPCSIRKGDGICGKPAQAGWFWEHFQAEGDWVNPGLYIFQPVCKDCVKDMMEMVKHYEASER